MTKDTYYFPHDYHARHDTKIEAMVNDYGVEGYGMYWVIIERLYESRNNKIEKFPKLFFGLATELCVSPDRAEKFVLSLINDYRLLEEDENHIWSDSVLRRMEIREQQRLMKVNSGRVGGIHSGITRKRKQNEAPLQEIEANEAKERKGKESKVKSNILPLSDSEFIESLKTNPAFNGIDINRELGKMDRWLVANPQRQRTRKFILRWLSKADKTIEIKKESNFKPKDPNCKLCSGTGFIYNQSLSKQEICNCRRK